MASHFTCPHCGADVPFDALACPHCGSDQETGWSQDPEYGELFLYDDEVPTRPSAPASWPTYLMAALVALTLSAYLAYVLPWGIYLMPLVVLAVGIAYYAKQVYPHTRRSMERRLYRNLLQKAHGDTELVDRLIGYERQRSPASDRIQHLQNAVQRWERDLR
jgi:hypothetical protein